MHINSTAQVSSPEDARLNNLLGAFAVALADRIARTASESTLLPEPLPAALIQIGSFSGSSSERLAKSIALSQSATTRVIQRLQEKGLISIETAAHDRRAKELTLTDTGERQRSAALAARAEVIAAMTALLASDEKTLLVGLLERVFPVIVPDRSSADFTCRYCDADTCPQACCPAEPESDTWKFNRQRISPEVSADEETRT